MSLVALLAVGGATYGDLKANSRTDKALAVANSDEKAFIAASRHEPELVAVGRIALISPDVPILSVPEHVSSAWPFTSSSQVRIGDVQTTPVDRKNEAWLQVNEAVVVPKEINGEKWWTFQADKPASGSAEDTAAITFWIEAPGEWMQKKDPQGNPYIKFIADTPAATTDTVPVVYTKDGQLVNKTTQQPVGFGVAIDKSVQAYLKSTRSKMPAEQPLTHQVQ
jgi:hypothetical protein